MLTDAIDRRVYIIYDAGRRRTKYSTIAEQWAVIYYTDSHSSIPASTNIYTQPRHEKSASGLYE